MNSLADALSLLQTPRTVFIVLLFVVKIVTGLTAEWVVRLMPALLSILLALSTFALVREGTGRAWVAAFAALLSVVSADLCKI
jgi:asparagine N-glycosylation enzyme membrane subunit Stt3